MPKSSSISSSEEIIFSGKEASFVEDKHIRPPKDQAIYELQLKVLFQMQQASHELCSLSGRKIVEGLAGLAVGTFASLCFQIKSLSTFVHEYFGHCLLGYHSVFSYAEGEGPRISIEAWEAWEERGLKGWIEWLFNNDGVAGTAWRGHHSVNALGEYLGLDKREAWISLSGSVPALLVHSAAVCCGVASWRSIPALGGGLLGYGLAGHLTNSAYPISAALMTNEMLRAEARTGHDFANFAVRIGNLTSFSPNVVAIATACLWSLSVPLLALGTYLFQKSQETCPISDQDAVLHWISQSLYEENKRKRFFSLYSQYQESCPTFYQSFQDFLLENLSQEELSEVKDGIVSSWTTTDTKDPIQSAVDTISTSTSITAMVSSAAAKVLDILGKTTIPSLALASRVCIYISPFLGIASVLSDAYDVYKDIMAPEEVVPMAAKVLSVAKVVSTVVGTTLLVVGTLIPGFNVFIFVGIALGTGGGILLAISKQQVLKRRVSLYQAIHPTTRDMMIAISKGIDGVDRKTIRDEVSLWVQDVLAAKGAGLIKDDGFWEEVNKTRALKKLFKH